MVGWLEKISDIMVCWLQKLKIDKNPLKQSQKMKFAPEKKLYETSNLELFIY